ncbi:protein of unknown function UCP033101 [Coriobacterium glomerans PW2]|uniref:YhfC family intramembrane metalloprotease n=2 Tax=Coriobacterium TaxID=33870 RepID=F2N9I0_CORGP|nr:protein of unknown function UCP033101 [Coriobacterium glomerans PW2]
MVSIASIICLAASALIAVGGPFILFFVTRARLHVRFIPVLIGAVTFIVFAGVFEQILHGVVLFRLFPRLISTLPFVYALYGALAAGVFEELGRACAFLMLRRSHRPAEGVERAIGYGIGHGGIESLLGQGLQVLNELILAIMANSVGASQLIASLSADKQMVVEQQLQQLLANPSISWLLFGFERACSISFHIAASVIVWMAVSGLIRKSWIVGAILLHALSDFGAGLYQANALPIWATELWAIAVALLTIGVAVRLYRASRRKSAARPDSAEAAEPAPDVSSAG